MSSWFVWGIRSMLCCRSERVVLYCIHLKSGMQYNNNTGSLDPAHCTLYSVLHHTTLIPSEYAPESVYIHPDDSRPQDAETGEREHVHLERQVPDTEHTGHWFR